MAFVLMILRWPLYFQASHLCVSGGKKWEGIKNKGQKHRMGWQQALPSPLSLWLHGQPGLMRVLGSAPEWRWVHRVSFCWPVHPEQWEMLIRQYLPFCIFADINGTSSDIFFFPNTCDILWVKRSFHHVEELAVCFSWMIY